MSAKLNLKFSRFGQTAATFALLVACGFHLAPVYGAGSDAKNKDVKPAPAKSTPAKTQLSPAALSTLKSVTAEQADTGPKFKSMSAREDSLAEHEEAKAKAEAAKPKKKKAPNEDPTPPAREGSEIFAEETSGALLLQAKQCMRQHNYNKALRLLKRALKLNDDDMDIRVLYAEALDEKLSHQVEKEPDVFNDCVKSWLMVARQEVGDEKGMTFKGIGIMGSQYADQDWVLKAKKRLRTLTGYSPKPWETDDRYLKKVLRPAETSVSGVVKSADSEAETSAPAPRKKEK